jgi:hypothetical protein
LRTWWDKALLLIENGIRTSDRNWRDRNLSIRVGSHACSEVCSTEGIQIKTGRSDVVVGQHVELIHDWTSVSVGNGSLGASLGATGCRTIEGLQIRSSRTSVRFPRHDEQMRLEEKMIKD